MSKLNVEKVLEIRSKHAAGATLESLCLSYGISPNTARSVVKGLTWQHVEMPPAASEVSANAIEASLARFKELGLDSESASPSVDPLDEILRRRGGDEPAMISSLTTDEQTEGED